MDRRHVSTGRSRWSPAPVRASGGRSRCASPTEGADVLAHDLNGDALAETAKLVADAGASRRPPAPATSAAATSASPRGRDGRAVRRPRRARQHRRHRPGRALPRRRGARLPPDDGRERRRLLLPRAGGHPAPARARRQHREHRVERRPHGPGVHRRLLHDQGRDRADDPSAGHGVRQGAVARERDRAGRRRHRR